MCGATLPQGNRSRFAHVRRGAATLALAAFCLIGAPVPKAAGAAQATPSPSLVCIAAAGVVHAAGAGGTCAPGQTPVPLDTPASGACESNSWAGTNDCDPSPPAGDDVLTALENRVKSLESHQLFEVVDRDNRPILLVTPGKVVLSNTAGDRVIELRATASGGHLLARNLAGDEVALAVSGDVGGLVFTEGGVKRIEYGKHQAGPASFMQAAGLGLPGSYIAGKAK